MRDWTAAIDCALLQTQTHCTLCGVRCASGRGEYDLVEIGALTLCALRCPTCLARPESEALLLELLQARYPEK
jgi:hypothetical protein